MVCHAVTLKDENILVKTGPAGNAEERLRSRSDPEHSGNVSLSHLNVGEPVLLDWQKPAVQGAPGLPLTLRIAATARS